MSSRKDNLLAGSNGPLEKVVHAPKIFLEFSHWLAQASKFVVQKWSIFNFFDDLGVYTFIQAETFFKL